ncbi:MAG: phage tail protein [Deltaproteobacteria bacterium]|nr:phage tail protein [Deltaproteobacteria bacterium]
MKEVLDNDAGDRPDETGATVTVTITTRDGETVVTFLDNASTSEVDTAFTNAGFDVTVTGEPGCYNILFNQISVEDYIKFIATDDTSPGPSATTSTNYPATQSTYYARKVKVYQIEIISGDGKYITEILDWSNGNFRDAVNEASDFTFRMRGTDSDLVDYIFDTTTRLRLRDRWGFVLGVFKVTKPRRVRNGDAIFVDVVAQTMLQQATREIVLDYKKTPSQLATVQSVMADLFALQLNDRPLGLGEIDAAIAESNVSVNFEKITLLDAIREVQKQLSKDLAGYFYVDTDGQFRWRLAIGTDGETLAVGERLQNIDPEVDYDSLITRIYMYGEGQDEETNLTLIDAGESNVYLDAASTATYGVIPLIKRDRRIRRPETLLAIANRILEEFSEPPTIYKINVLDIAKADSTRIGWQFEDIYKGSKYQIIDEDLGIDATVITQVVEYNLDNPVPVRVELDKKKRSLSDIMNSIIDETIQPLDVDGELYPTMGRNYSSKAARLPRKGDGRWYTPGDKGQMHDGDDWRDLGEGAEADASFLIVETVGDLPSIPAQIEGDDVFRLVYWTSAGAGNGDDQLWFASSINSQWWPMQKATEETGTP